MMMGHLFHAEVLAVWQGMPMGIVHFEDKDRDAAVMVSPAAKLVQKFDGARDAGVAAGIESTNVVEDRPARRSADTIQPELERAAKQR